MVKAVYRFIFNKHWRIAYLMRLDLYRTQRKVKKNEKEIRSNIMPLRKDYICLDCNEIFEFAKEMGSGEFPENPPCTKCESTNTKKYFGNIKKDKIGITVPIYMRSGH